MKKKSVLKHRQPNRSPAGDIGNIIFLVIVAAFTALPLVYIAVNAFKPMDEIFLFPPRFFVRNPTLNNFRELFVIMSDSEIPFTRYIFNTVFITAVGTIMHIVFSSMAAYALTKVDIPGRKLVFKIIVSSLLFTPAVTAVPNFLIMSKLKLVDTVWAIVFPVVGGSMGLFLMKQFMESIPDALIEAATIDGANSFVIFYKIVMPQVKPAWLTLMIFSIQNLWNSTGGIYIYSEKLKTLPFALSQILAGGYARTGASYAVTLLMMIVPIIMFVLSQSNVVQTMSSSGIKE